METEHMLENSRQSWRKASGHDLCQQSESDGAGFGTDTNVVTLIRKHSSRNCRCNPKKW
ncbi:MAG: hypothetical protein ACLTXT_04830 [Ruminococcus callidus]